MAEDGAFVAQQKGGAEVQSGNDSKSFSLELRLPQHVTLSTPPFSIVIIVML